MTSNVEVFHWRDRRGNLYKPAQMETRHIFYVLRMLWNHTMPEPMRIEPYNDYVFTEYYDAEYIEDAIINLATEISKRCDLKDCWRLDLAHMCSDTQKVQDIIRADKNWEKLPRKLFRGLFVLLLKDIATAEQNK